MSGGLPARTAADILPMKFPNASGIVVEMSSSLPFSSANRFTAAANRSWASWKYSVRWMTVSFSELPTGNGKSDAASCASAGSPVPAASRPAVPSNSPLRPIRVIGHPPGCRRPLLGATLFDQVIPAVYRRLKPHVRSAELGARRGERVDRGRIARSRA